MNMRTYPVASTRPGQNASVSGVHTRNTKRCNMQRCASAAIPDIQVKERSWIDPTLPFLRNPRMMGDPMGTLFRQRIIFLGGEVEDVGADALVSQLLILDQQDTKDIKLFINSPGGSVTAGLGIYDAMQMCKADVQTYCFGLAASMGAFLLGAGKKGKRYAMPNARIMIHQPLGGAGGQAVDMEIQAKEIMYHKSNLNRIIAEYTGQPINKVEADTDRDNYMNPLDAKAYGIIDHVVGGEQGVFAVKGSLKKFPKIRDEYVIDQEDLGKRSILDGDPFFEDTPSLRFRGPEMEPYMPSLESGQRLFRVQKISKDRYKEIQEEQKLLTEKAEKKSAKEKIDQSW